MRIRSILDVFGIAEWFFSLAGWAGPMIAAGFFAALICCLIAFVLNRRTKEPWVRLEEYRDSIRQCGLALDLLLFAWLALGLYDYANSGIGRFHMADQVLAKSEVHVEHVPQRFDLEELSFSVSESETVYPNPRFNVRFNRGTLDNGEDLAGLSLDLWSVEGCWSEIRTRRSKVLFVVLRAQLHDTTIGVLIEPAEWIDAEMDLFMKCDPRKMRSVDRKGGPPSR